MRPCRSVGFNEYRPGPVAPAFFGIPYFQDPILNVSPSVIRVDHRRPAGGYATSRDELLDDVRYWHIADVLLVLTNVCFEGEERTYRGRDTISAYDPKRTLPRRQALPFENVTYRNEVPRGRRRARIA